MLTVCCYRINTAENIHNVIQITMPAKKKVAAKKAAKKPAGKKKPGAKKPAATGGGNS